MKRIYLASFYDDRFRLRTMREVLEKRGFEVTSRWIERDEPRGTGEHRARKNLDDIKRADALVFFSEPLVHGQGQGGRHVELGIALGTRMPIFLVGEPENAFHELSEVTRVPDLEALIEALETEGFETSNLR